MCRNDKYALTGKLSATQQTHEGKGLQRKQNLLSSL